MYLLAKNRGIVSKLLYLIKDTNIQHINGRSFAPFSDPRASAPRTYTHPAPKTSKQSENLRTRSRNGFGCWSCTNAPFTLRRLIRKRLRNCCFCLLLRS